MENTSEIVITVKEVNSIAKSEAKIDDSKTISETVEPNKSDEKVTTSTTSTTVEESA